MKRIIKKLFIPILFIGLLFFAITDFSLNGKNKVEAASSDVTIPGSNTSIRIVYTTDLFVSENYTNEIDGIPTSKEFYVTIFVNTTNGINALNAKWNFNTSEIDTITAISYVKNDEEANINSITGEVSNPFTQTTGSLYASVSRTPSYASYLGSIGHGHTGTKYLEGNAKQLINDGGLSGEGAISASGGVNFALAKINVSINTATNTSYVLAKFKVKLKSSASSFTLKMDTTNGIAMGGNDKTGAGAITGPGVSIFDSSIGAGSLSDKVDTVVTAYKSNQTTKIGTANLGNTVTTGSIEVPAGTTSADLGISVDGGKGSIASVTGATLSGSKYVVTNIPTYSSSTPVSVTINVTSEDGNNSKQYTLTFKQAASSTKTLNSLTISKNVGQNDPIITTSLSEPTSSTSSVISFTPNTQYYVWISAQETGVKVVANYTAQSATLAGTSYSSGATQTVLSATNASFSLVLNAENNDTASYNFTFKTITDGAKVSGATVSSGSTQLGTGTPNTSDVIDIEIDYADANGNVYTNPTLQFTLPTNHTKLTCNGQALSSSGLTATYTGISLSTSSDPNYSAISTITIIAEDTLTGESKTYTVNVKRRLDTRSNDANLNDLTVSYNGTNVAYTPTLNGPQTYTLTTHIPYTVNALDIKTVLSDANAKFTLQSSLSGQSLINGTNNSSTSVTIGSSSNTSSFAFTITIKVTPENQNQNDVKTYIISGTRDAAETTNTITAVSVIDNTGSNSTSLSTTLDSSGLYYDLGTLPYTVKSLGISANMGGSYSSMTINGAQAVNGQVVTYTIANTPSAINNQTVAIVVTPQSGTAKTYYVRFSRAAADTTSTATFTVYGDTTNSNIPDVTSQITNASPDTYYYYVPANTENSVTITATATSSKAKIQYSVGSGAYQDYNSAISSPKPFGTYRFKIIPEAGDSYAHVYTLIVKEISNDATIDTGNLTVAYDGSNHTYQYNPSTKTFTLDDDVPYVINNVNVTVNTTNSGASFKLVSNYNNAPINGSNGIPSSLTIGNSQTKTQINFTITISVLAADGITPETYKIVGVRKAAETTNTIDTNLLTVTDTTNNGSSQLNGTWDSTGTYYNLGALPYSVKSLGISAHMSGSFSSMKINGTNAANDQLVSYNMATTTSAIPQTDIAIVVTSQSGISQTYYVRFTRNAPDTQNEVTDFTITADDQTIYSVASGNMTAGAVTATSKKFTMTIPYTVNDVELRIQGVPALAKAYYDGNLWSDWSTGYKSISIGTVNDTSQIVKTIKFTITSEANTSMVYEITVTRDPANTDTGVTFTVIGDTTGQTINPSAPISGTAQAGHTYYYVKQSQESGVKIDAVLVNQNSGTKIMYSTDNGATYTQEYINATAQSIKALGSTYYFRALPQAGVAAAKDYALHIEIADERDDNTTLKTFQLKDDQGNIITPTATSPTFTSGCAPLTLTYEVPFGQGNVTMEVVATKDPKAKVYKDVHDAGAIFSCDTSTITAGQSKTFQYYVKAENETYSPSPYQITIKRLQGNSKVGLQTLTINGQVPYEKGTTTPFSSQLYTAGTIKEYEINLGTAYNGVAANVVANLISNIGNATITTNIQGTLSSTKKDSAIITATSEDGKVVVTYKVTIYTADDDNTLQSFNLLDAESSDIKTTTNNTQYANNPHDLMDSSGNQVFNFGAGDSGATATINYANRKVFYDVLWKNTQKLYVKTGNTWTLASTQIKNIVTLNVGQNKFVFGVVSELDALKDANPTPTNIYTFVLTVNQADVENKLATFDAKIGGIPIASSDIIFNPNSNNIIVNNVGNYSSNFNFDIVVTKVSDKSNVYMPNDSVNEHLTYSTNLSFATGTNSDTFSIKVVPESGVNDAKTYTVTVFKNSATLDSDTTLGKLTITGVKNGVYYDYIPDSNATSEATPDSNSPTLIIGDVNLTFSVGLPTGSKATRYLGIKAPGDVGYTDLQLSQTTNSVQYTVQTSTTQDLIYYLEVYAIAEDSTPGTKYYVKIIVPKTSDDNTSSVTSPDPSNTITDIPGTNDKLIETKPGTTDVPISVTPSDPDATVAITTPNGSNLTFTPSGNNPGQGTIGGLKPGNNKVTVKVTAPNGDDTTYDTYIWVDETPELENMEVWDAVDTTKQYQLSPQYQQTTFNYTVDIPYSVNSTILKYAFSTQIDSSKLNVKYYIGSSSIANSFSSALEATINTANSVTIRVVVSQNYNAGYTPTSPISAGTRTYEIEFKKASPSTDCELLTIDADGTPVPNGGTYVAGTEYVLDYGRNTVFTNLTNITYKGSSITVTSSDTTVTPLGNNNDAYRVKLVAGKAVTVTLMVNPEDPTAQPAVYKFVLVAANKDKDVANLELFENNQTYVDINNNSLVFNANTPQYPFTAKNSTNVLTLRITKPQYSTVEIGGVAKNDSYGQTTYDYTIDLSNTVSPNKYTVDVRLLSEYYVAYGQNQADASDAYKIEIERQALDNDATLSSLVVTIDGQDQTIFATKTATGTFNIPNVGNITSIGIKAIPTKNTTKIDGSLSNPYTTTFILSGSLTNDYMYQFVISTVAEGGATEKYTLNVSRGPIDANDDKSIVLIEAYDSNNTYYIAQNGNTAAGIQQFDPATKPYTITMPYGATSYTITGSTILGSYAKIYITDADGNAQQTNVRQFQITNAMYGQTITHKVYAQSGNGAKGDEYTITIKFEEPNVDNSLKSLTVDGDEQITSTTPNNPTFTISRPNSVTTVDIAAIVSDPTATIASNSHLGRLSLVEGQNVFNVTVIAQNGDQQTYTIIVNRDYANPTLMDLGVTGETLLDYDTKKVTTFEPNTTKYFVRVPYTKETADIYAYSSSVSDVILGTGTKNLLVGDNKFTVKITSVHGTTTEYELHIYRLPEETMNASLDWLKVFQVGADKSNLMDGSDRLELKDENAKKISDVFNSDKIYYGVYNVNGKVGLLDVKYDTVVHGNEFYDSPVVTVLGADNLHIGKNQVVILVTAPDGIHQKAYVIEVERDDIAYNVLEDQIESDGYTLEKVVDKLEYNINIGKKKTSEVDFLSYIEALNATGDNAEQELEITYKTNIENNPDDVIIEIATKDGITKQVIFHVESTSNHNNADFWTFFPLIILLVIVLIILIMILISVNKDKYGKITRKADKKSDKKEKAANK